MPANACKLRFATSQSPSSPHSQLYRLRQMSLLSTVQNALSLLVLHMRRIDSWDTIDNLYPIDANPTKNDLDFFSKAMEMGVHKELYSRKILFTKTCLSKVCFEIIKHSLLHIFILRRSFKYFNDTNIKDCYI